MTEQSTTNTGGLSGSTVATLRNQIDELKKSFYLSIILLMITGQWDSQPKQILSSIGTANRTHLI
jgi:hypothetical protein